MTHRTKTAISGSDNRARFPLAADITKHGNEICAGGKQTGKGEARIKREGVQVVTVRLHVDAQPNDKMGVLKED
jgi:hypothetical protein